MGTQMGRIRRNRTSDWRASYRGTQAAMRKMVSSCGVKNDSSRQYAACMPSKLAPIKRLVCTPKEGVQLIPLRINPGTKVKSTWVGLRHSWASYFVIAVLFTAVAPLRGQDDVEAVRNELRNCQRSPNR